MKARRRVRRPERVGIKRKKPTSVRGVSSVRKHKKALKVLKPQTHEKLERDIRFRMADAALAYWQGRNPPPDEDDAEDSDDNRGGSRSVNNKGK
jgi:hypothetical protein